MLKKIGSNFLFFGIVAFILPSFGFGIRGSSAHETYVAATVFVIFGGIFLLIARAKSGKPIAKPEQ